MDQEFSMEKQEFTLIKEKIIKTNDLLLVYNEKDEKLTRATQAFKNLKAKFEETVLQADGLRATNERLTDTLKLHQSKYDHEEKELTQLKVDYSKLEGQYQQYLIETQLITTDLQERVKQCTCEENLSLSPSKKKPTQNQFKELKHMCDDLKDIECKLKMENNDLKEKNQILEAKVKDQARKSNSLLKEQYKLQNEHKNEIIQLKKEISKLLLDNSKLKVLEEERDMLKQQIEDISIQDFTTPSEQIAKQHKCKPIDLQPFHMNAVIGVRGEDDIHTIREMDNDTLDMDITFSEIFREMILPRTMLSPLSISPESATSTTKSLPNIIITPPTPNIDSNNSNLPMQFPVYSEVNEGSFVTGNNKAETIKISVGTQYNLDHLPNLPEAKPDGIETLVNNAKKPRSRPKFWMPYSTNTIIKRKQRVPRNDTILDALRILQQNNINFNISNGSLFYDHPVLPQLRSDLNSFNYKLDCLNKNCNSINSFMKLRMSSQHEEPDLLGFFNVKDEVILPSQNRFGVEEKAQHSDVHYLAEQIIQGIKELTNSKQKCKRRKRKASEFNSETESELERLFRGSVLGRNRQLIAAARRRDHESDSDFMVDSGLVTATPKSDSDPLSLRSPVLINKTQTPLGVDENITCDKSEEVNDDSLDLSKMTFCPLLISPLASSVKSSPEENSKKIVALEQLDSHKKLEETTEQMKPTFCQKITFDNLMDKGSRSPTKENIKVQNTTIDRDCSQTVTKHPLTERDLFGEFSDSEDNNEAPKPTITKKSSKKTSNLKARVMRQVRSMGYAYGNKNCDKLNCAEPKSLNVIGSSSNKSISKKNVKKITIEKDILMSQSRRKNELRNSISPISTISDNSIKKGDAQKINQEDNVKFKPQRRKNKLDEPNKQTPTDIVSQVIQDMTRTRPKQQAALPTFSQEVVAGYLNKATYQDWDCPKSPVIEIADLDCPRSPDVVEMPDRLPKLIPTDKPTVLPPSKVRSLMNKLVLFCNEDKILENIVKEFAFQEVDYIVEVILNKLYQDTQEKATRTFPGRPPLTNTQRILLGFLVRLNKSTHQGILDKYLATSEMRLFNKMHCKLDTLEPLTRLYAAICRMRIDLPRIRKFVCESFYFAEDFAVPILFIVLTVWPDVLPMQSETSKFPLAKVIVQLCYLKSCNMPGYNLMPLRGLLHKYYGYPTERWNCEELFQEILVQYIQSPSKRLSDFTLLLYLKNKPATWVYKKIKENFIPLYRMVPESNSNLKATLVILLANICLAFNKHCEIQYPMIREMDEWFQQLEKFETSPIVQNSLYLARGRLPKRKKTKMKKQSQNNLCTDLEGKNSSIVEEIKTLL